MLTEQQLVDDLTVENSDNSEAKCIPMIFRGQIHKVAPAFLLLFGIAGFVLIYFQTEITDSVVSAPLLPTTLVVAYSLFVYFFLIGRDDVVAVEHYVDTTYFLGYFYTLVAIFSILVKYDLAEMLDPARSPQAINEVVGYLGTAVLTTIVAIIIRNVLRSASLQRGVHDLESRLLRRMDELKVSAQEFSDRYQVLIKRIIDSDTERKEVVDKLKNAEQQYLSNLTTLNTTISEFCNTLDTGGKDFRKALKAQQSVITGCIQTLVLSHSQQQEKLDELKDGLGEFTVAVTAAGNSIRMHFDDGRLERVIDAIGVFRKEVRSLEEVLDDFIEIVEKKVDSLGP